LGIQSVGRLSNTFSGMAILISCLGLFGLSAFLAERRKKEISIRKVLGASTGNLWFLLSKDFLKPVIIAFLIATPLAIYAMQKMLDSYDYRIRLAWWMFALGGFLAILIAFLTVSFQGIKTALSNPIKALKSE
jgi:ABC-type antimicrobial peptide transport system permease subunit